MLCANNAYAITISGTLPVMYIETENRTPITSKTEYLEAKYWLDPLDNSEYDALGSESEPLPMQIRGRGHSSWKGTKKPYKIKFAKKTSIMGLSKNKHFALLKPSENTIAGLQLGKLMNMALTPDFRPVEVVLNGDYIGLYFFTETIRIDENRVNIFEQQDQETDPNIIPYGWLVEVDNYLDECQITIPECSQWNLTLRYHSPENLSAGQLQWLTNEFNSINAAIYSANKTSTTWEDYIDVESMARFFILQEVMDNPDGFHGSFYLHKDLDDNAKWVAGPIWDLVCYNREKTDYTFRMTAHYKFTPHWIGEIIQYDNFCQQVKSIWTEVYPNELIQINDCIDDIILPLETAWSQDCARWGEDSSQTVKVRSERIKNALSSNIDWFNSNLPISPFASIGDIEINEKGTYKVYNLQGVYLGCFAEKSEIYSKLPKGIYIVNGQKIVIK